MARFHIITRLAAAIILLATGPGFAYVSPESVTYDPIRHRYLVSDQGNGNIIQIDSTGHLSIFSNALSVAKGLFVRNDSLFAAGGPGGLFCFDLETGEIILEVDFPGQNNLNDVAADSSGYVYASDPQGNQVFRVRLNDLSMEVVIPAILMPNGMFFDLDNQRMLLCQWVTNSPITAINLTDFSLSVVANDGLSLLDGLTEDNAGNIYVSSFDSDAVFRYDRSFSGPPEVVSTGHTDPGDIFYNKLTEVLAVPNVNAGRVDFIHMPVSLMVDEITLSDEDFGDGDGIPEKGETIDLTFQVRNSRSDSISDLRITLALDDASLFLYDGEAFLEGIPVAGAAGTETDPMVFSIPDEYVPRVCHFYLEIEYVFKGEQVVDSVVFEQQIGQPRVLLIDDDDGGRIENYYIESLTALHVPSTVSPPSMISSVSELLDYDVVLWYTGNYRDNPIGSDEISLMTSFLDAGGNLLLSGQGIAASLDTLDPSFLNTFLKSYYVVSAYSTLLAASSGCQAFTEGDTIKITGPGGASNQSLPDRLAVAEGGVSELNYFSESQHAAVSFAGIYRMIFCSFGFEAIVNGDSRWTERDKMMSDLLAFFGYSPPAMPMILDVVADDSMHVINDDPEITWAYGGPGYLQQQYHVQAGNDMDWTTPEMWDSGPVSGSESSVVYAGETLLDGQMYYVRVRVSDGLVWSLWYHTRFRMNSAPGAPSGLSPDGHLEIDDSLPVLSLDNATDAENDQLWYDYEIFADSMMSELVLSAAGLPEGSEGISSWQVSDPLPRGDDYFWRARAHDGYEYGPWSALASFLVTPAYRCGDANGDETINVADAVYIINYIFKGGPPPDPPEAGNANCDGTLNVADAVYLITYIFKGGPEPCCP